MRLNKELAIKILGDVSEGQTFVSEDGREFKNLTDLRRGLKEMTEEIFSHHTENGRNDFSNWIRECVGDARLADGLMGRSKEEARKKIRSRINYVRRYLESKV
jgi:hypothetical protein